MGVKDQVYCLLDFETYSELDLKKVGAYEYSMHPSTGAICVSFSFGTRGQLANPKRKVLTYSPFLPETSANLLILEALVNDPSVILVAHNGFFDAMILRNSFARRYFSPHTAKPSMQRWVCTMAMAQVMGLPRNLEDCAIALDLLEKKDKEGNRLVKKWCKPRKATKKNKARWWFELIQTHEKAMGELRRIVQYCESDIRVERHLFTKLPLLDPVERRLWLLTQRINLRGFCVDRSLVQTILGFIDYENRRLDSRLKKLTGGQVPSATQAALLKEWICAQGFKIENLQKKTILAILKEKSDIPGPVRKALKIRQARSKSSTAKYVRFEQLSRTDGRVRGCLVHHAALTGRWGGALVQPQNFPRGTIENTVQASGILAEGNRDLVRLIYGNPMNVYSSCLRNMIVPSPGKIFDVADYSQIEARVLFWMADHHAGLAIFRDKTRDIYKEMARDIFGIPVDEIHKDSFERFVGKEGVLGCGFQMGKVKFRTTVKDKGCEISEELAERTIQTYRQTHKPVVQMWANLEKAAISAVLSPGRSFKANRCEYWVEGDFLFCKLPSGRRLAYHKPSVRYEMVFGQKRHTLYYWMVDPKTKKRFYGKTYGGKLTENVVQADARDIMAAAKIRISETRVWDIVLSVHDELIGERDIDSKKTLDDFIDLMKEVPSWAKGCPIDAGGWTGMRYRK